MENVQYINRILEKISYKLIQTRRNGKGFYKLSDIYLDISINGKSEALSELIMQILDSQTEYCETQIQQSLELMPSDSNSIYKSEGVAQAKDNIEKAIQPNIFTGDFVDLDCGKTFIKIVAISKEKSLGRKRHN
ncbi:MAG: hypothetical protein F6K48_16060 [Okeania sp. SIO3H1]|nr:hypothetical protein [Okeania sp. SIO3H1]